MFISPTLLPKAAPRSSLAHHYSSSTCMRRRTGLGWALSLQPPPFPTDGLTPTDVAYDSPFTHVITESRDALPAGQWEIVEVIDGFMGWKVLRDVPGVVREKELKRLWDVLEMKKEDKLWIFERRRG
ncbi:hypothetical protein B0F90DRAFT_1806125 [Multifurca ochricompacta]|uniref:Uncharacterized protein n=1 Tax=Multifurca ochricompacta TaxID=376703 RepID=A0AAD4LTU6_9AGAM|nr:hypothetical protein B0F90DRAFT_1806125 [Multifurca ochricompacta]